MASQDKKNGKMNDAARNPAAPAMKYIAGNGLAMPLLTREIAACVFSTTVLAAAFLSMPHKNSA